MDHSLINFFENFTQIGKFFASQYYGLLCGEPDQMRHFYSEHSTLIHVINGDDDDATRITSDLDKIEKYLSDFNIDTVEIKSTNSLNCWGLGILLVVMGSLKLREHDMCRNFVETMYLAPHWKRVRREVTEVTL
jgi:hypothetical protein